MNRKQYYKEYARAHRQELNAYYREYNKKHREQKRAYQKKYRLKLIAEKLVNDAYEKIVKEGEKK